MDRSPAILPDVRLDADYDVSFALQNLTRRSIRIVGLKTTCSCVVPKDYPRTLAPLARVVVPVKYHPKTQAGPFREQVTLLTDDPVQPRLWFEVNGTIAQPLSTDREPAEDQLQPIPIEPATKGNLQ